MNKEIIKKARQTNLPQYLIKRGEKLKQNGQRFRHIEHESLVFTENAYYWNSHGEHGNAIDFLMKFYDMSFKEAVKELAGQQKKESAQLLTEQTFSFSNIVLCSNMRRTIAYLNKSRFIDYNIIQKLIKENYIFQEEKTNNIIFPIYDESRLIVGAEVSGTLSNLRYKSVKGGTKYGYGFNISIGQPLKYAIFFESAIDLISFMEIERTKGKPLTGCLLTSIAGLKENIIEHTLKAFRGTSHPLQAVLSVDNDEAGKNLSERLKMRNKNIIMLLPDKPYKDWNEQLRAHKIGH